MTFAQFQCHLEWVDVIHAILRGAVSEDARRRLDVDRANRQVMLQSRFPMYYPPLNFDED